MPVVIGQVIVALWRRARIVRISLIVISLPRGTRFMMASTSLGAGMAMVPRPQPATIPGGMRSTLGSPLSLASFSRQVFAFGMAIPFSVRGGSAWNQVFRHRDTGVAATLYGGLQVLTKSQRQQYLG